MGDMILGRHIVAALCLNGQFYGFGAVHRNAQLRQYQYCERTLHQNHRSGLGSRTKPLSRHWCLWQVY